MRVTRPESSGVPSASVLDDGDLEVLVEAGTGAHLDEPIPTFRRRREIGAGRHAGVAARVAECFYFGFI